MGHRSKYNAGRNQLMQSDTSTSNINPTAGATHPSLKPIIIATVAIFILIIVAIAIAIASNSHKEQAIFDYPRTNTLTMQIYAALDDEMTFDDLDQVVHNIDPEAKITKEDFYGEIKSSEGSNQSIYFYFDPEDTGSEEEEDEEEEEYPSPFTTERHDPNIAYDFRFIYDTTYESSPVIYRAESASTYKYDDGGYADFDFETKQDAIDAFLAPVVVEEQ